MTKPTLKELRERRAWSQTHLAHAAGVNVRTIQRLEAGEAGSPETLLCIAAALDVPAEEIGTPTAADGAGRSGESSPGDWSRSRGMAAIAFAAAAPAALFVAVNLLRRAFGISLPYDLLAQSGGRLIGFAAFNLLSPPLFLGGLTFAIFVSLRQQVRPRIDRDGRIFSIRGIDVRPSLPFAAVLALSAATGMALLAYQLAENFSRVPSV